MFLYKDMDGWVQHWLVRLGMLWKCLLFWVACCGRDGGVNRHHHHQAVNGYYVRVGIVVSVGISQRNGVRNNI